VTRSERIPNLLTYRSTPPGGFPGLLIAGPTDGHREAGPVTVTETVTETATVATTVWRTITETVTSSASYVATGSGNEPAWPGYTGLSGLLVLAALVLLAVLALAKRRAETAR